MQARSDIDEVFGNLISSHGDDLVRFAYQLTHDSAAAEDLVQESLLLAYRQWRKRDKKDLHSPAAYLRRVMLNEYLGRRRLRVSTEIVSSEVPEMHSQDDFADQLAERERVWSALGRLSKRQRAVLVLRYYEELPDRHIADLLQCREATVRSLAARGLDALRSRIDGGDLESLSRREDK